MRSNLKCLVVLLALFAGCFAKSPKFVRDIGPDVQVFNQSGPGWESWCLGNCQRGVTTSTSPIIAMMGGGGDVDEAFEYMIDNSNGGDFIVLRTSGDQGYNPYIYRLGDSNSVTTILITSRTGAQSTVVENLVRGAEAIFMAGGDQSTYVGYWADTPLSDAMDYAINTRGVPVGGTSAGLHVLGEFIYTGERGSAVSDECLDNPYNFFVTLTEGFLKIRFLENLVTDSHFEDRDRMGRSITFLARLIEDGYTRAGVRGVCVDEATALLVSTKGVGQVVGDGFVYFLRANESPSVCSSRNPLSIDDISVYKMDSGSFNGAFDLVTWVGAGGRGYTIDAVRGELDSTQSGGAIY